MKKGEIDTEIRILIDSACKRRGISKKKLAACLCISESTFYRKYDNPGAFTAAELAWIAIKTNMDADTRTEMTELLYRSVYARQ